jgi:hypothetical protein
MPALRVFPATRSALSALLALSTRANSSIGLSVSLPTTCLTAPRNSSIVDRKTTCTDAMVQ